MLCQIIKRWAMCTQAGCIIVKVHTQHEALATLHSPGYINKKEHTQTGCITKQEHTHSVAVLGEKGKLRRHCKQVLLKRGSGAAAAQ